MLKRMIKAIRCLWSKPQKNREWMLWIGNDYRHTPPEDVVGSPVDFHGRKGVVVERTDLTILVEWSD